MRLIKAFLGMFGRHNPASSAPCECERLRVQLAGCGVAALGYGGDCKPGDYGWSASFGDVMRLRAETERLRAAGKEVAS